MKTAIIKVICSNRKEYLTTTEDLQELKRYSIFLIHKVILSFLIHKTHQILLLKHKI